MKKLKHGNCYGRAFNRLLKQENPRGWRLVHGYAFVSKRTPGQHAWLRLPDGRVWDPTDNAYVTAAEYETAYHATPIREYTKRQAVQLGLKHRHYGPWYNEKALRFVIRRFWEQHCGLPKLRPLEDLR